MEHRSAAVVVAMAIALVLNLVPSSRAQLSQDFYAGTCPNAESIVTSSIMSQSRDNNVVPLGVFRLLAHDCFVDGCDASILISGPASERTFSENANLPQIAFDAIDNAKQAVEAACPGVVSCADILAMAARDAVVFHGGPSFSVLKGRRDGRVSDASRAQGKVPSAHADASQLIAEFAALGLDASDLVILSGSHTVGFSHCDQFSDRLYRFGGSSGSDPSLDASFIATVKQQCPVQGPSDTNTVQAMDITSPFVFDNAYYINLLQGKGLLTSDSTLASHPATSGLVSQFAASQDSFFQAFGQAMIKMSSIGVKTGRQGEIRRVCTKFNGQ